MYVFIYYHNNNNGLFDLAAIANYKQYIQYM